MSDDFHPTAAYLARADERERCALLAEELAAIHEASAKRLRIEGEYTTRSIWPFGHKVTLVRPGFESAARVRDQAASSLRIVAKGCRAGWDPRRLSDAERADIGVHFPGRDPEPGEII